jgi:acyl carrier protein phosphodiesterase
VNHLAHLYFSGPQPELQVGGLLGDFVKGPLRGHYPAGIEAGIRRHRRIDAICAELPAIRALLAMVAPCWRRYAGIAIDLAFDHLLARQWAQFHHRPLRDLCVDFYGALAANHQWLPAAALRFCDLAPQQHWLERYDDEELMQDILEHIGRRLRHPRSLRPLWHQLQARPGELEAAFQTTMDALVQGCGWQPDREIPPSRWPTAVTPPKAARE